VLGAVGLFAKWKYRYDDRMNELEARARRQDTSIRPEPRSMSDRSASPELITTRFDGPAPEVAVSTDMIKRGLARRSRCSSRVCGVIWGLDGVWSSAYGIAIVLTNFALAAAIHCDAPLGSRSG
jgi:hypothetical protein